MSEMVEKVARAIFGELPVDGEIWRKYFTARKAIEAMREPTKQMLDEAYYVSASGCDGDGVSLVAGAAAEVWKSMIDEVLK